MKLKRFNKKLKINKVKSAYTKYFIFFGIVLIVVLIGFSYSKFSANDNFAVINTTIGDFIPPQCGAISGESTSWTGSDRTISVSCIDNESGCTQSSFSKTFSTTTEIGSIEIEDIGGNVATCLVNAYVDKNSYNVNIAQASNGTIYTNVASAKLGDTITVYSTPTSSYKMATYSVNGSNITSDTFTMGRGDVNVSGLFIPTTLVFPARTVSLYKSDLKQQYILKDSFTIPNKEYYSTATLVVNRTYYNSYIGQDGNGVLNVGAQYTTWLCATGCSNLTVTVDLTTISGNVFGFYVMNHAGSDAVDANYSISAVTIS